MKAMSNKAHIMFTFIFRLHFFITRFINAVIIYNNISAHIVTFSWLIISGRPTRAACSIMNWLGTIQHNHTFLPLTISFRALAIIKTTITTAAMFYQLKFEKLLGMSTTPKHPTLTISTQISSKPSKKAVRQWHRPQLTHLCNQIITEGKGPMKCSCPSTRMGTLPRWTARTIEPFHSG